MAVPASPPLRMTILACLNDRCDECRLPVDRCESEGGRCCVCAQVISDCRTIGCSVGDQTTGDSTPGQRGEHHRSDRCNGGSGSSRLLQNG